MSGAGIDKVDEMHATQGGNTVVQSIGIGSKATTSLSRPSGMKERRR